MGRRQQNRCGPPRVGAGPQPLTATVGVGQFAPVKTGHIQKELLSQLFLPLDEHRCGHQQQGGFGSTRQQQLSQNQPGFDGLAQAHLVGQKIRPGPSVHNAPGDGLLVGPRHDAGRGQAHTGAGAGRLADVVQSLTLIIGERWGFQGVASGRSPALGHQLQQAVAGRFGQGQRLPHPPARV